MVKTLIYLRDKYGEDFLRAVARRMAHDVYRSIYEDLKRGETEQLQEFWEYFLHREGGSYTISMSYERVDLELNVQSCPVLAYLRKIGIPKKDIHVICDFTRMLNEALIEDTPFKAFLEFGENGCCQTICRR